MIVDIFMKGMRWDDKYITFLQYILLVIDMNLVAVLYADTYLERLVRMYVIAICLIVIPYSDV